MDKITNFKQFVKNNPELVDYVKKDEMSWQKFYEMYDIYGESNDVWNKYLNKNDTSDIVSATSAIGFADILAWIKSIDLDSLQEGINSISRVVGVLQDFGDNETPIKNEYKPRPLYKHFED